MASLHTANIAALREFMTDTIFTTQDIDSLKTDQLKEVPLSDQNAKGFTTPKPSLDYWGSNKQGILYIIENAEYPFFSPLAEDAFLKTNKALGLSLEDIAVINLSKHALSFEQLVSFFKPTKVVLSGVNPTKILLNNIKENSKFTIDDIGCLSSYSFDEMLVNLDKKKSFWIEMKNL